MSLDKVLSERLAHDGGPSHRDLKPIAEYHSRYLKIETGKGPRQVLNFASNDYLALSTSLFL